MVTVINRPLGHKLTDQELNATVYDSSGEALFLTEFAHGLITGDYVYVQSNIASYNGYKYVTSIAYNEFKLRQSQEGDFVQFKQSISATYRISVLPHGYLAISQPIVYELESDLFPVPQTETYYSARVVDSVENNAGYTQLNISESLESPEELDYIQLIGDGPLEGAYKIITVLQQWSVVIDLAYSALNDFSGYEVAKYYNNYCINVEVWGGLDTDHPWYDEKPYENLATLKFRPDDDGRVKFSISEILKGQIRARNKLDLDTLPNNLDFFTGFYIKYYETYDSSDGEEVTTLTGPTLSDKDEFEGHAVNADMPFKSLYESHMSEYLNEDTYYAQWLVLQERPIIVIGYFFDASFINSIEGADILILRNGELYQTIENPGIGIIRVPLEADTPGEYCFKAQSDTHFETVEVPPTPIDLAAMTNEPAGGDLPNWTLGSQPTITGQSTSDNLSHAMSIVNGQTYKVNYKILIENKDPGFYQFFFELLTAGFASTQIAFVNAFTNGLYEGQVTFNATANAAYLTVSFANSGVWDMTVQELSLGDPTTIEVEVPGVQITEELCVTVLEECDDTLIEVDDARLLEDGDFRLLE